MQESEGSPLVSVIIPTFNAAEFIEETINSVLQQSYSNFEILITDDSSSDDTWNILMDYSKKDKRIKVFRLTKNCGPGVARNNSIKHAEGRFIAFCDSDDQWLPDKLRKQISFMNEKDCALSYSSYKIIDESGNDKGQVLSKKSVDYRVMLRNNYIGCLTAMYDTEKVGKMFMPKIRKRQDWALWLNILKKTDKAYGILEPLAIYRLHDNSISTNKIKLVKYNYAIYRKIEDFSTVKSLVRIFLFFFYYFKNKMNLR